MKTVNAVYNGGRWIVYCPKHGKDGAVIAENYHATDPSQSKLWTENDQYICPICYPGIAQSVYKIRSGNLSRDIDKSAQRTARALAEQNGDVYKVIFPKDKEKIEKILAPRPPMMRNWDGPHETLKFLENENKEVARLVALVEGRKR